MKLGAPRTGCAPGREDERKTAKWLMKQAERTDQQTVFLLNLLQEHKVELEARDDIMRESSKLIRKLQVENESLKQQLLELRITHEPGNSGGRVEGKQCESLKATTSPAQQTTGAISSSSSSINSWSSSIDSDIPSLPGSHDPSVNKGYEELPCCISADGSIANPNPRTTCNSPRELWARMLASSQPDHNSTQPQQSLSSCQREALPLPTAGRQLHNCNREFGQVPSQIAVAVIVPCERQDCPAEEPGTGSQTGPIAPELLKLRMQMQSSASAESQGTEYPVVKRKHQPSPKQRQLEARCMSLTEDVERLRVQLKQQQLSQESLLGRGQKWQQQHHQPTADARLAYQLDSSCNEVTSLGSALEAAKQQAAAAEDKYLTCKKDLDVLSHKYDSLMLQKLEVEEQTNRLFNPNLDIALVRQAMPAVDAAMVLLEERLREVVDLLASNRLEAEDAVRAHNATRKKWIATLEGLQVQLEDREARLRKVEAQLAAAAAATGLGLGTSETDVGIGARNRTHEQQHRYGGKASSEAWGSGVDSGDHGL